MSVTDLCIVREWLPFYNKKINNKRSRNRWTKPYLYLLYRRLADSNNTVWDFKLPPITLVDFFEEKRSQLRSIYFITDVTDKT